MVKNLIDFPMSRSSAPRVPDSDLAAMAASGDMFAFEKLVRRHQATVRGLLVRLTGNQADADDIAQSSFLKAWSKISSYNGGQFKSWICTLAYREFLQENRRNKSRRHLIEELAETNQVAVFPADKGLSRDLDRALAQLPDSQRIAVVLCIGVGLSHNEVAVATGWPLGTVKSHVARGKSALQTLLGDYGVA
ncbi:MAG: RNA polymerase sigma factor [Pseudomonadota bacterium]